MIHEKKHRKRRIDRSPSTTVVVGRDAGGRFGPGNAFSRGGAPLAERAIRMRAILLAAVTAGDLQAIAARLVAKARSGDLKAIRELLNRLVGKPAAVDPREPLEIVSDGEAILAARVDSIRSLKLAQARGEELHVQPDDDRRLAAEEIVDINPLLERRRVRREVRQALQ